MKAPSLRPTPKPEPPNDVSSIETIPIEFVGRQLTDRDGELYLGWIYEGAVYVDDSDLREVPGGVSGLPAWLATQISSDWGGNPHSTIRCVGVTVLGREGTVVNVIAEIRV